jgi:hypothetical protein
LARRRGRTASAAPPSCLLVGGRRRPHWFNPKRYLGWLHELDRFAGPCGWAAPAGLPQVSSPLFFSASILFFYYLFSVLDSNLDSNLFCRFLNSRIIIKLN